MWTPPDDLDPEIRNLVIAMNHLPGIQTTESCSGHGKDPVWVWFEVPDRNLHGRGLITLARVTCNRYYANPFTISISHGDINPVGLLLEGPVGGFKEAEKLADDIMAHVQNRTKGYNILLGEPWW